jgi:hypothetical protein
VIPDGFVPNPEVADPNILCSFFSPPADPPAPRTVIRITRMRQVITPGARMDGQAPRGVRLHEATETWKGYHIPASKMVGDVDGVRCVLFRAQVPLTPEAVTVHVGGAEADEPGIAALFQGVLASLDGETNWAAESGDSKARDESHEQGDRITYWWRVIPIALVLSALIYIRLRNRARAIVAENCDRIALQETGVVCKRTSHCVV